MSPGRHPFEPLQLLTWTLLPIPALSFPSSSLCPAPVSSHFPHPDSSSTSSPYASVLMTPWGGGLTPDPEPSVLPTVKPKSLSSSPAQLSQPSPIKQAQCWVSSFSDLFIEVSVQRTFSGPWQAGEDPSDFKRGCDPHSTFCSI